jgi:hypothetical protein
MLRRLSEIDNDCLSDLRGINIYGPDDEKLGSVDDALVDDVSGDLRYLVVDAGWLKSRQFIVPAGQVYAFDDDKDLYANLRQRDVETLPEFHDESLVSDAAFANYESDYRRNWRYDADASRMRESGVLARFRDRLRSRFSETRPAERHPATRVKEVTTIGARPTVVYGVYADRDATEKVVSRLRNQGFDSKDVSVVFPDREMNQEFAVEKHTKAPEGALAAGGSGLVIGGVLGWLVGIGALAIPGAGPLIAAGPIVAALTGVGVGTAVGGIAGALIGLGVPELEAKRYEEEIKRGRILVSVHCESVGMAHNARKILEDTGGKAVFLSGEQRAA